MIRLKRLYANNFKQLQEIELKFPEHGRILVQGKNEAGKSTLFEAVFFALFGSALATEGGTRSLDDLIRYDIEKARVELDLQFGDRLFQIRRSIVRGKTNTWELDIVHGEGNVEEIRGNSVVNKRLVAELGFDGEALLNTCFVEQKKLEKLEGLSKAKREESLAKLLNLDALVQIENDLKVTAEDKRELDRLKKRADLAAIQAELPVYETQLAKTEEKLKLIDLRNAVDATLTELNAVQKLDAAIQTLATQREQIAQRVEQMDALRQAMQDVKTALDAAERANEQANEVTRLKQEHADLQRAFSEISNFKNQLAELGTLVRRLTRLDQVRAAHERHRQRAQQIAGIEARLNELNATIVEKENALVHIEKQMRDFEIGEALGNWIAAQNEASATNPAEDTVKSKQAARHHLAQKFKIEVYGLAALLLLFLGAGVLVPSLGLAFFALGVLAVISLALRATASWHDLSRAAEELGQAEGEARTQALLIQARQARVREAEHRLQQLNVAIPATVDLAQAQRVILAREMNNQTLDDLRAMQTATREELLNTRAVLSEVQRQFALDENFDLPAERARNEQAAHKAETIWTRWQARITQAAEALPVALDLNAIQQMQFKLQAQIEQLQRRANESNRLTQDIIRRENQVQTLFTQAREAYERARAVKSNRPAWDASLTTDDYIAFGKELRAEYNSLGGDALLKQARDLEGELGRRHGERTTRARNLATLYARVQEMLGTPSPLSDEPQPDELTRVQGQLAQMDLGDDAALRAQQRELVGRVRSLSDRAAALESDLGLQGQILDRAETQREWEHKVRETMVRERGVEITAVARRRIVQKILPTTMDYMRRLLPRLTNDRYDDIQLDPETYKIQVWDKRANHGAFKEKNIFSGGTKDQFSLALRLAFALATLPVERGSAPSFIFLDEPLGSFDDERAEALINLLTEGEIARAFDQIFLISHVHVNERLFTHHILLEHGRVAESDLPA